MVSKPRSSKPVERSVHEEVQGNCYGSEEEKQE
jgi:hypothetical protein